MLDQHTALKRLKAARDSFWFSLGAYALLTEEPSRSDLQQFQIRVTELNAIEVSRGIRSGTAATSYTIGFNAGLDQMSALGVVEYSFRQMLLESFQIAKEYAEDNTLQINAEPWYEFARHYRNGIAHNGKWHITSSKGLPVTWRNRTVDASLHGTSLNGFLTWFEGLQLGAQMNLFVSRSVP